MGRKLGSGPGDPGPIQTLWVILCIFLSLDLDCDVKQKRPWKILKTSHWFSDAIRVKGWLNGHSAQGIGQ